MPIRLAPAGKAPPHIVIVYRLLLFNSVGGASPSHPSRCFRGKCRYFTQVQRASGLVYCTGPKPSRAVSICASVTVQTVFIVTYLPPDTAPSPLCPPPSLGHSPLKTLPPKIRYVDILTVVADCWLPEGMTDPRPRTSWFIMVWIKANGTANESARNSFRMIREGLWMWSTGECANNNSLQ